MAKETSQAWHIKDGDTDELKAYKRHNIALAEGRLDDAPAEWAAINAGNTRIARAHYDIAMAVHRLLGAGDKKGAEIEAGKASVEPVRSALRKLVNLQDDPPRGAPKSAKGKTPKKGSHAPLLVPADDLFRQFDAYCRNIATPDAPPPPDFAVRRAKFVMKPSDRSGMVEYTVKDMHLMAAIIEAFETGNEQATFKMLSDRTFLTFAAVKARVARLPLRGIGTIDKNGVVFGLKQTGT